MKSFWVVIVILFLAGLVWLDSPDADAIRARNQHIEVRPNSPAAVSREVVQGATGASDLMSDTLFMAALASGVVFVLSRLMGGNGSAEPKGEVSDEAAKFIAMVIGVIVIAAVLG